jgi:hypothetical protein
MIERILRIPGLIVLPENEKTKLPGFEQDDYVVFSNANERSVENILREYRQCARQTIALFEGFDDAALLREGIANNNKATVRALGYHIAGHVTASHEYHQGKIPEPEAAI